MTALETILSKAGFKQASFDAPLSAEEVAKYKGTGEAESKKGNPLWFSQAADNDGVAWSVVIFRKKDCTEPSTMTWNGSDSNAHTLLLKVY